MYAGVEKGGDLPEDLPVGGHHRAEQGGGQGAGAGPEN